MITSYTRLSRDDTPQQFRPDSRCEYCEAGLAHSQWAHEDAVEEYLERADRLLYRQIMAMVN
jgi:hypothetical protein